MDVVYDNIHDPNHRPPVVQATRSGNTWTIPAPLDSYKTGAIPNTWRISLSKVPPPDVTYHIDLWQTFIRSTEIKQGLGKTYPPTTR